VWETAPAIGEVPGTWVELARRLWNVTSLPIASVMLELKAGSSSNETVAPGTVVFDTFAASNEDESAEVILVEDDFNDNSLAADWIEGNVFSGATDTGIPVDEANQRLEIGPLPLNNSGYNGVRTAVQAFAGGYAYVRLVSAPASNTAAYAMYTVGDADTHYRFWIQANTLVCEEKINNVKSAPNPCATTYSPAAHQFLRISHDTTTNEAVWAVAPASGSGPGAFTELARRTWSTASLPLTGVMFELKGGSSSNETNPPGIVAFDTFKAARPQ
jgi:hypothetical protein